MGDPPIKDPQIQQYCDVRGARNWASIMLRDASLSDSYTSDHCCLSSLWWMWWFLYINRLCITPGDLRPTHREITFWILLNPTKSGPCPTDRHADTLSSRSGQIPKIYAKFRNVFLSSLEFFFLKLLEKNESKLKQKYYNWKFCWKFSSQKPKVKFFQHVLDYPASFWHLATFGAREGVKKWTQIPRVFGFIRLKTEFCLVSNSDCR